MGTVKRFNATKGFGFIKPDGDGQDVFVHISAVERAGYTGLAEGAKVSYELITTRFGKTGAEILRLGGQRAWRLITPMTFQSSKSLEADDVRCRHCRAKAELMLSMTKEGRTL